MGLLDNAAEQLGETVGDVVDEVPVDEVPVELPPVVDPIVAAIERERALQPQREVDRTLETPDMLYLKDFR